MNISGLNSVPGKAYAISVSGINFKNFVQFSIPFLPIDRFKAGCDDQLAVKIVTREDKKDEDYKDDRVCDLVVTSLNWINPNGGGKPDRVRISLGYADGSQWIEVGDTRVRVSQDDVPNDTPTFMWWKEGGPDPLDSILFRLKTAHRRRPANRARQRLRGSADGPL